jgi:hypothetical protein
MGPRTNCREDEGVRLGKAAKPRLMSNSSSGPKPITCDTRSSSVCVKAKTRTKSCEKPGMEQESKTWHIWIRG